MEKASHGGISRGNSIYRRSLALADTTRFSMKDDYVVVRCHTASAWLSRFVIFSMSGRKASFEKIQHGSTEPYFPYQTPVILRRSVASSSSP